MTCTNTNIREMLPCFIEGSLDADGATLVRGHLALCSDCSEEVELLKVMASEQVPDPGEAFWASIPDRVYRETQRTLAEKRTHSWWQGKWWSVQPLRGAIAFALIVLVSWVLIRPAHRPHQVTTGTTGSVALEDLYEGPSDVEELATSDISLLSDWLEQGIAELGQDLGRTAISANGFGRTLDEDLSTMDREELDDVIAALSQKQEV